VICECSGTTIGEAIRLFQETELPYKKAKKLVTKCDRSCCRNALMPLFNMVFYGKIDLQEVKRLLQ